MLFYYGRYVVLLSLSIYSYACQTEATHGIFRPLTDIEQRIKG